jgi:hypothetical protein
LETIPIDGFAILDLKGQSARAMLRHMKSALGLILGFLVIGVGIGCGGGGDDSPPIQVGGSGGSGTGGSSVVPGGTGTLGEGVPLTPNNGWVPADNVLMIQGAMFPFGDDTSKVGMMPPDFSASGDKACIKGTAAKVDMTSMPCTTMMFTPPAKDCYGQFWGAAIGMNLNQMIDMTTMAGGTPAPFDASALTGFAFEISGDGVPGTKSLRFKVENASGEFCNPGTKPVNKGPNKFLFGDLVKECWNPPSATTPTGETAKKDLIKIAWQVVTNAMGTVPFDFCVSNVRALQ